MAKLIECTSCGGLKRAESERCPHCRSAGSSLLKGSLAAVGFGALAACGSGQPCTPEPLGVCAPIVDSGNGFTAVDAYGVVPIIDGGFTGADAYGIAPASLGFPPSTPPSTGPG